jgi:hypothetical protein
MQDEMDMYEDGISSPANWDEIAQYNTCFAQWLRSVDALCERFLDLSFQFMIERGDFVPEDSFYEEQLTPEKFFCDCVVPYVALENGEEFVEELIGDLGMWGIRPPRNLQDAGKFK